jgi:two-component system, cell cycle sensor histidine kinase and response regulator CckA
LPKFQRFSAKAEGHGVPIALSTIFASVNPCRDSLTVKSKVDKDATFCVFSSVLNQLDPILKNSQTTPVRGNGETILLVEDESALREMAASILEDYNYRVLKASCGPEAIKVWEANKGDIALLFTDLVMPKGLSGIDIGERFLNEKPSLELIYTSGYRLESIPKHLKVSEKYVFVPKPYKPSVLVQIIRQTLDS